MPVVALCRPESIGIELAPGDAHWARHHIGKRLIACKRGALGSTEERKIKNPGLSEA
jgi:hypothetical protein